MTLSVRDQTVFSQPPRAVLFDADNTLYPYAPAHAAAMDIVLRKVEQVLSVSRREFEPAFAEARKQVKQRLGPTASSHSRLLYFQRALELLGLKTQVLLAVDFEQTYWRAFLRNSVLHEDVAEFLDDLRMYGIPTVMVTNLTAQIQFRKLIYFNLDHAFDFVVTSEEAGVDKPDAVPFKLAIEKLQVSDGPIWMIGDEPEADMSGARNAIRAQTLLKRQPGVEPSLGGVRPDLVFDRFSDLRRLVQSIVVNSAA